MQKLNLICILFWDSAHNCEHANITKPPPNFEIVIVSIHPWLNLHIIIVLGGGGFICTQSIRTVLSVMVTCPYPWEWGLPLDPYCNKELVAQHMLVSQARHSHSTAFSSFRISTRREGLAHCLYPFGSTRQDIAWPIRFMENMITSSYICSFVLPWPAFSSKILNYVTCAWLRVMCRTQSWIQTGIGSGPDPPSACLSWKN